MEAHEVSGKNV